MIVFSKPVLSEAIEARNDDSSKKFKRKMTVKNSVGNQHKFSQQIFKESKRSCSSSSEEDKLARSEDIEDTKIQNAVEKLSFCCSSSFDDGFGCLLKLFRDTSSSSSSSSSSDNTSHSSNEYFECYKRAVAYVKQCRQLGKQDNPQLSEKENRDNFLQEVFRQCIVDQEKQSNGKEKFSFKFCIPSVNNRLGNANRHVVCKQTLLSVYGFTEHDWRICSSALKTTDTGRVSSLRHKPWTDDVLHDYTFAEAEDVFADELGVPKPGLLIDSSPVCC
jgi:hypothetical protein